MADMSEIASDLMVNAIILFFMGTAVVEIMLYDFFFGKKKPKNKNRNKRRNSKYANLFVRKMSEDIYHYFNSTKISRI